MLQCICQGHDNDKCKCPTYFFRSQIPQAAAPSSSASDVGLFRAWLAAIFLLSILHGQTLHMNIHMKNLLISNLQLLGPST